MPNYQQAEKSKAAQNAYFPLIGFIVMVILGVIAWFLSPAATEWVQTTDWVVVSTKILPISFPGSWDDFTRQVVVALGTFLLLFALAMIPLVMLMGSPMGETDVSLAEIRKEKEAKSGKRKKR